MKSKKFQSTDYPVHEQDVGLCSHKMKMEVPGHTVNELVEHWGTGENSHLPAFVSFNEEGFKRQLTRRDVRQYAKRFAYRLKKKGVEKGDIICNAVPNSLERIICEFGIMFSGAVSMNGQIFRSDGEDFLGSLETSKSCMVIVSSSSSAKGARNLLLKEVPEGEENHVKSKRLPHLKCLIVCQRDDENSEQDFLSSLKHSSLPEFSEKVSPSDLATIMTTSGSTGYSKLVKLSHANICHFALQVKAIEPLNPGDHFMNCAPLGWAGGYPQWYLGCGITRYFLDMYNGPPNDLPSAIWKTMVQEKVVYGFLSPMYVNAILSNPSLWKDSSWKPRILCLAGQPVKKELLAIIGKLCDAVDINYGITECNLVTTHRITDLSTYVDGCAGFPGYGVQMKIVDKHRNEVPKGQTGEVIIWSPALCQGYLNNEDASMAAFTEDGWFYTDDAGYIGENGKLYVEGRQSDSILRGAYVLYPGWLEKKMREVNQVKDVVVVAVPDKVLHNEICAFVVTSGVEGTVKGTLHESSVSQTVPSDSNHVSSGVITKDETDGEVLTNTNSWSRKNIAEEGTSRQCQIKSLDQIRSEGLRKPISIHYNETRVKMPERGANGIDKKQSHLEQFEKQLRQHADKLELLSEKDAMRMVPKYYIFSESLPLTNTGKISRKEIRKISASLLDLDG